MRFLLGLCLLLLAVRAYSAEYVTRIHQIDPGVNGEKTIVLLTNGKVVKLSDETLANDLLIARDQRATVKIAINDKKEILSLQSVEVEIPEDVVLPEPMEKGYTPSVVPNADTAYKIFKSMNRRYNSESQCYNRAHVWSWEMYNKHYVRPMQVDSRKKKRASEEALCRF